MPKKLFCIYHVLLSMDLLLTVVSIPSENILEKHKFCFRVITNWR